eukprot:tig00021015_g17175.t1
MHGRGLGGRSTSRSLPGVNRSRPAQARRAAALASSERAGPRCTASFVARDKNRNVARTLDVLDAVHAEVVGPARCFCEVKDGGEGTFEVGFRPQLPGDYALHIAVNGEAVQGSPLCWTVVRERAGRSTPALRQPLGASLALVQSSSGPHASAMQRALLCAALQRADAAARPPRTLLLSAVCTLLDSLRAATVSLLRFAGGTRGLEPDVFICTPRRASEMTLGADPALGVERGWARGFEGADEDGCPHAVATYAFADALRTFAASLTPEDIAAGARCVLVLLSDGRRLAPEHFEPRLEALVSLVPQLPPLSFHIIAPVEADQVFLKTVQGDVGAEARGAADVVLPTGDSREEALEVALATIKPQPSSQLPPLRQGEVSRRGTWIQKAAKASSSVEGDGAGTLDAGARRLALTPLRSPTPSPE